MRVTKKVLEAKISVMNNMLNKKDGERYYVGYENGSAHLFKEVGSGRQTISYGHTKTEIASILDAIIEVLAQEEAQKG